MRQRVLLATFSIRPIMPLRKPLIPPFPHFDPFGPEFREPGRVSHPDPNRLLQRSFQLAPEFLTSTRQSRFHCSHTDVERDCNFFVSKSFNVSQQHRFSINPFQRTERSAQCSFAFMSQSVLLGIRPVVSLERSG